MNILDILHITTGRDAAGGNASLDLQNSLDAGPDGAARTGLDLLPTSGVLPTAQALCEEVLYWTRDKVTHYKRVNRSALADGSYRVGMEVGEGQSRARATLWAYESGGGSDVTPGNEEVLGVGAEKAGDSFPIEIRNGHLVFIVPARGGLGGEFYLARGGGSDLTANVPTGGRFVFLVNNAPVFVIDASGGHTP